MIGLTCFMGGVRVEVTSTSALAPPPLEGQQNKRPQRSQRLTDGGKGWGEGGQGVKG